MRLEELDFPFPEELIAQEPVEPRDSCRLLHLTAGGHREHRVFSELPEILRPGDMLVFNDSRVLPARVEAHRATGGKVELLFLRPVATVCGQAERWEALARPSHRLKPGETVDLGGGDGLMLMENLGEGRWLVASSDGSSLVRLMEQHGRLPLPPYVKRYPADPSSYQTVYAAIPGSAAAPTAGLHFTPELLDRLGSAGVAKVHVTLHVGLDTFQPIREEIVEDHVIHRETFSVGPQTLALLRAARAEGRRLIAVGTTVARVLETLGGLGVLEAEPSAGPAAGGEMGACVAIGVDGGIGGSTQIYITPGHVFRAVDALITNFHLPHSTVLALTMAFTGLGRLREAYTEGISMSYRFFSFGDAMLVEGHDADA